jgi:phytoene/squalene synthetase
MKNQKGIFDAVSLECSKKTTKIYSTSFSIAIKLLSKEYQDAIYSIYGFVRLADEIVDSFHDYNKSKLLNELRNSTIDALEKNISLNPIINSFQNTVRKYNIEWILIDSFLESMEYDLSNQNCNEQAYKKYIQGSAEAVGLMCLQIFTNNKKGQYQEFKPFAESLGSAFQKINFLRDMKEDYNTLNRVYFPSLDIKKFSNTEKKVIENDIAKDFAKGLIGIKLLDKDSRKGVYLAYKYYMSLFRKIQKTDAQDILRGRIRISNIKKMMILISSQIELKIR